MRRYLVATDEAARHPFLASLPPHVRSVRPPTPVRRSRRITAGDVRDFLMAYVACFMAASVFFM